MNGRRNIFTHIHRAFVHQAAKSVAALLRVVRVTSGLEESNGSLPPGLWLTSPAGWLPRTGISSGTLRSVIEYGLPLPLLSCILPQSVTSDLKHTRFTIISPSIDCLFQEGRSVGYTNILRLLTYLHTCTKIYIAPKIVRTNLKRWHRMTRR